MDKVAVAYFIIGALRIRPWCIRDLEIHFKSTRKYEQYTRSNFLGIGLLLLLFWPVMECVRFLGKPMYTDIHDYEAKKKAKQFRKLAKETSDYVRKVS